MVKGLESILELVAKREVIFEHQSNQISTQTHAIDAETGVEVLVTSPRHARRQDQELLALKKLARSLVSAGILTIADGASEHERAEAQSGNKRRPTRGIIA